MKKHSILKVVLLTILVVGILSWVLPTGVYDGAYTQAARDQIGIFDFSSYPMILLMYFGYVLFFVLTIGAFYGVLYKIPAYRSLLDKIVKGFKGKEWIFLSVVMVLCAIIVSIAGLSLGILALFPFVIAIVLLMGYNKLVAASVTVGSSVIGLIGTTFANANITTFNSVFGITDVWSEIITKVALLVLGLALLIFNVLRYAKKVKHNTDTEEALIPEKLKTTGASKKIRIWPLVVIFDLILILMIMGSIPWEALGVTVFSDALDAIVKFEIFDFPLFAKILGNVAPFGKWSIYSELPALLLLGSAVLALLYRVKFKDFIDGICQGMKKACGPACVMSLVYLVLIITTNHAFQLVIVKFFLDLTKGLNVVTMSVVAFLSSIFNVEASYVANRVLPYVTTVITDTKLYPLMEIIFQSIYGLAMLVVPTSVVLVGTLSYLDIPYLQWLKHIWKLFLEILVVLIIIFLVLLLI